MPIERNYSAITSEVETTVAEVTNDSYCNYQVVLFFKNLSDGDKVNYKIYIYDNDDGEFEGYYYREVNYSRIVQGHERAVRIPWVATRNIKVTLIKTAGNNNNVNVQILETALP